MMSTWKEPFLPRGCKNTKSVDPCNIAVMEDPPFRMQQLNFRNEVALSDQ